MKYLFLVVLLLLCGCMTNNCHKSFRAEYFEDGWWFTTDYIHGGHICASITRRYTWKNPAVFVHGRFVEGSFLSDREAELFVESRYCSVMRRTR